MNPALKDTQEYDHLSYHSPWPSLCMGCWDIQRDERQDALKDTQEYDVTALLTVLGNVSAWAAGMFSVIRDRTPGKILGSMTSPFFLQSLAMSLHGLLGCPAPWQCLCMGCWDIQRDKRQDALKDTPPKYDVNVLLTVLGNVSVWAAGISSVIRQDALKDTPMYDVNVLLTVLGNVSAWAAGESTLKDTRKYDVTVLITVLGHISLWPAGISSAIRYRTNRHKFLYTCLLALTR
ncbi:hypothetical protein J6590_040737 [Homalodisca vitripennis]|nr:hypothetical protein J6590_040737 [Homalodisca vitripennis]